MASMKDIRKLSRHFRFLTGYRWLIAGVVVMGLVGSFLEGLGIAFIFPVLQTEPVAMEGTPRVWQMFMSFFTQYDLSRRLQMVALWLIAITAVKAAVQFGAVYAAGRLQVVTVKRFRAAALEKMLRMGMGDFHACKSGYFQTVLTDYSIHMGVLVSNLAKVLPLVFTLVLLTGILLVLSWKVVVVSLMLAAGASFLLNRIMAMAYRAGRQFTLAQSAINNTIAEMIKGAKVIRLFAREAGAAASFEKDIDGYNTALLRRAVLAGAIKPLFELVSIICVAVILLVGSLFLIQGGHSMAVLSTFILVFYRVTQQVLQLNHIKLDVLSCLPCVQEMDRFLSSGETGVLPDGATVFEGLSGEIVFDRVTFTYPQREEAALKDVTLTVPRGCKIGIVGPSGAGKSTVTELLLRFYDPAQGAVRIDGRDLRDLTLNSWRRKVALVSQDIFLFHDTVRANIAFACPEADAVAVERAARLAHAHEFILSLPEGYDTVIGDRGVFLSGGQRQRMAIARAVLTDPDVLIFDEATSALDTQSEQMVQQTLDELAKGRTVVTIAHRLSTIRNSDRIVVMEAGRIVEEGTHEELVQRAGLYARLNRHQLVESAHPRHEQAEETPVC